MPPNFIVIIVENERKRKRTSCYPYIVSATTCLLSGHLILAMIIITKYNKIYVS